MRLSNLSQPRSLFIYGSRSFWKGLEADPRLHCESKVFAWVPLWREPKGDWVFGPYRTGILIIKIAFATLYPEGITHPSEQILCKLLPLAKTKSSDVAVAFPPWLHFQCTEGPVLQAVVCSLTFQVQSFTSSFEYQLSHHQKGTIMLNLLYILRMNFFFSTVIMRKKGATWGQISMSCRMTSGLSPIFWYPGLTYGCLLPMGLFYCQVDFCHKKVVLLDIENSENGKAGSLGSRKASPIELNIFQ